MIDMSENELEQFKLSLKTSLDNYENIKKNLPLLHETFLTYCNQKSKEEYNEFKNTEVYLNIKQEMININVQALPHVKDMINKGIDLMYDIEKIEDIQWEHTLFDMNLKIIQILRDIKTTMKSLLFMFDSYEKSFI